MTVKQAAHCELARRDFFEYCHLKAPDFYKRDRAFLKELCHELQDFFCSDDSVFIINMPPRHGKSRTASCFVEWILGQDCSQKIMTGSYNETLSTKIARILSNSTWVMEHIYFPVNWKDRFPEYYDAMIKYQREGKNKHDDAPDCTTGIAEKVGEGSTFSFD